MRPTSTSLRRSAGALALIGIVFHPSDPPTPDFGLSVLKDDGCRCASLDGIHKTLTLHVMSKKSLYRTTEIPIESLFPIYGFAVLRQLREASSDCVKK